MNAISRPAVARRSLRERGQAMVETAIVMPSLIFFILGIVQLGMIQHARLMLEYAAFSAARAGIVWNANQKIMDDAAVFALTPTFGISGANFGNAGIAFHESDTLTTFGETYILFQIFNNLGGGFLPKLVQVDTLNPTQETLQALNASPKEIDFDEPAQRQQSQLTIRVRYYYNMRIPFANWIIWQSFMAANAGIMFVRRVDGWYWEVSGTPQGPGGFEMGRTNRLLVSGFTAKVPGQCYNNIPSNDFKILTILAAEMGTYFVPIVTTYTMRMQSNPILANLPKAADVMAYCN